MPNTSGARGMAEILRARALAEPDTPIITVVGRAPLTFAAWESAATAFAERLARLHLAAGSPLLLRFGSPQWDRYAVAYLGAILAGHPAVPLSASVTEREARRIGAECSATAIVACDELGELSVEPCAEDRSRDGSHRTDADHGPASPADEVLEILATSGSTDGTGRLVACTWKDFRANLDSVGDDRLGRRARLGHAFPVGTNAGQLILHSTLRPRTPCVVVAAGTQPENLRSLVDAGGANILSLTPTDARALVRSVRAAPLARADSVFGVFLTGAAADAKLSGELARSFPTARVINIYGLTEGGTASICARFTGDPTRLGQPSPGTEVKTVVPAGEPLPPGCTGEIWIRKNNGSYRRYLDQPSDGCAPSDGGWIRTGDLGRIDADGTVYLIGRSKDIVIRGGANISCAEVEAAYHSCPEVREVAVLGVDDELLGEDLVAVVVPEGPASEESIRGLLDGAIDRMKIPSRIHLVDELPRLRSGKVDKNALRDMVQHELSSRAWSGGQEPGPGDREALSRAMRDIWERALRRKVSDRDDFYAMGGDSLATVGILSAAEAHLGFGVDLADVYPFGTLDDFVEALRRVLANRRIPDRSVD